MGIAKQATITKVGIATVYTHIFETKTHSSLPHQFYMTVHMQVLTVIPSAVVIDIAMSSFPHTVSIPACIDKEMNGTLHQDQTVRYNFPVPVTGITVKVCISVGHVIVYGSVSVPNPNSAFYDWLLELDFNGMTETCKCIFLAPSKIISKLPPVCNKASSTTSATASTSSRVPHSSMSPCSGNTFEIVNLTIHISVVATHNSENSFVVSGIEGDVCNVIRSSSSGTSPSSPSPGASLSPGATPTCKLQT